MDQALARFKLADAQLQQSNCIGALTNYMMILERYDRLPEVKTNLFEPALYQAVRAALGAGDLGAATNALSKLLAWYPDGFHTQPAALLIGESLARHGDSAAARRLFQDFAERSAGALPEVGLAIARTYEEEGRWTNAIGEYDRWLQRFPDNRHAPSARFYLAQANSSAGNETNALTLFTNFVAHFPTNDLTPLARWWAADYFLRNDKPIQAEEEFRLLWLDKTNSPGSEIPFQACLMAGRAAVKEESYPRAIEYFTNLTGDVKHCPADLWVKAMFAYGDTLVLMGDAASTNKLENYDQARSIFSLICKTFPTNAVTPLALGRMADCLVQSALAAHPYGNLTNAAQAYQQVIDSPYATVGARSQARIAQGFVLEKQAEDGTAQTRKALLQAALAKYLEVWSGRNLGPGERAESFWFKKAGLEAARVAEEAGEWDQARGLYEQLQQMLPASRASLARSMIRASEKIHPQ
jgi:tetratricopeptide (TPR) repeat protein